MNEVTGLQIIAFLGCLIIYWLKLSTKKRTLLTLVWLTPLGTLAYGMFFPLLMLWVLINILLYWSKVSLKIIISLNIVALIVLAAVTFLYLIGSSVPRG